MVKVRQKPIVIAQHSRVARSNNHHTIDHALQHRGAQHTLAQTTMEPAICDAQNSQINHSKNPWKKARIIFYDSFIRERHRKSEVKMRERLVESSGIIRFRLVLRFVRLESSFDASHTDQTHSIHTHCSNLSLTLRNPRSLFPNHGSVLANHPKTRGMSEKRPVKREKTDRKSNKIRRIIVK